MTWRYINPGYVHLLDKSAQSTATQVTGYEYSKTGVGFYNTSSFSYDNRNITLPDFKADDDFWVKFDFFFPNSYTDIYIVIPCIYRRSIYIRYSSSKVCLYWRYNDTAGEIAYVDSTAAESATGIKLAQVNSALIHVRYGKAGTAHLDICINGKEFSVTPNQDWTYSANEVKKALLYSSNRAALISNIIISNEEINLKEQVVALPVSATETAMTAQDGGIYLADSIGQTLLQSVNVSSLIDEYGGDSKVTSIAVFGTPAYRTGEQLSSLTAISKRGGVITEYGKSNLSTASDTVICQGFSTASDTTIADLQNMQFGWKASE